MPEKRLDPDVMEALGIGTTERCGNARIARQLRYVNGDEERAIHN